LHFTLYNLRNFRLLLYLYVQPIKITKVHVLTLNENMESESSHFYVYLHIEHHLET
jgi:hypothetical protein